MLPTQQVVSRIARSNWLIQLEIFWDVYWMFLKFQLILDNLIANSIFLDTHCFLLNKHAEKSFIHLKIHSKLQKNLKKRVEVCPKIKLNLWWTSCVCRKAAFILSFFMKFYISRLSRSLFHSYKTQSIKMGKQHWNTLGLFYLADWKQILRNLFVEPLRSFTFCIKSWLMNKMCKNFNKYWQLHMFPFNPLCVEKCPYKQRFYYV